MDFKDSIKQLSDRVIKLKDQISTEEGTKNAFIMPFLQALGYDVFNPLEVVPEYVTDIGTKKGEKIDYAIFKEGNPVILIECKHWEANLTLHDNQLLRYFHVSKAKFGILCNGITYKFYSDLVEPNKMDEKPFLEFSINEIKENQIEELKKFHKSYFDVQNIVGAASELKYMNELKQMLQLELSNPSADFVRHFAKQVYPSKLTEKVMDQFSNLVKKSVQQYISDLYTERLKTAIAKEEETEKKEQTAIAEHAKTEEVKVITTDEEKEAFLIVKTLLRQKVSAERINVKDAQTYCAVLLDNNNRKPICRFYFNGNKKFIVTFDELKNETKREILSIDDIYKYSGVLLQVLESYLAADK